MEAKHSRPVSERVIGCAYAVSNRLGAGFLEAVYENALCVELARGGLQFERQKAFDICYRGTLIGHYVADIVVKAELLVELKALSQLTTEHEAQVMNYLKASGLTVALLFNFGTPRLTMRRIVLNYDDSRIV